MAVAGDEAAGGARHDHRQNTQNRAQSPRDPHCGEGSTVQRLRPPPADHALIGNTFTTKTLAELGCYGVP